GRTAAARCSTSSGDGCPRSPTCARCSATSRTRSERDCVGRIIGIDLGTTNSLVAVLEADGPRVLPDPETGERLLPSAVAFLPGGEGIVGAGARALVAERPLDTILSVKRFMGLGPEHVTEEDRRRYRFAPGSGSVVRFEVEGRTVTPPEVSAYVLREL